MIRPLKTKTQNISITPDLLAWALGKIRSGGYNNISEVVREALRHKRAAEQAEYLNPPPLPSGTLRQIYASQGEEENEMERRLTRRSVKKPEPR